MERTIFDVLRELVSAPAQFWSLFVLTVSLMAVGVYIGASGRYILNNKRILENMVTKQDLQLAFANFIQVLDGRFQLILICKERHEALSTNIERLEST